MSCLQLTSVRDKMHLVLPVSALHHAWYTILQNKHKTSCDLTFHTIYINFSWMYTLTFIATRCIPNRHHFLAHRSNLTVRWHCQSPVHERLSWLIWDKYALCILTCSVVSFYHKVMIVQLTAVRYSTPWGPQTEYVTDEAVKPAKCYQWVQRAIH